MAHIDETIRELGKQVANLQQEVMQLRKDIAHLYDAHAQDGKIDITSLHDDERQYMDKL